MGRKGRAAHQQEEAAAARNAAAASPVDFGLLLNLAAEDIEPRPQRWPITPLGIPNVPPPLPPLPDCILTPLAIPALEALAAPANVEWQQETRSSPPVQLPAGMYAQAPASWGLPPPQASSQLAGAAGNWGGLPPPQALPETFPLTGDVGVPPHMLNPQLPPLPDCIFSGGLPPALAAAVGAAPPPTPVLPAAAAALPQGAAEVEEPQRARRPDVSEVWEQDADKEAKMDRRTFFHTGGPAGGKSLTFMRDHSRVHREDARFSVGEYMRLSVEEMHFGNARVRVTQGPPAPLPQMIKWPHEKFEEHILEAAQISFGSFWVWCATGIASNRVLYAAKRGKVLEINAIVVEPPAHAASAAEEDHDLTYGASIQGIQLVP